MAPAVPAFLSHEPLRIVPVSLPAQAVQPGLRPFVLDAHLKAAELQIAQARGALEAARTTLAKSEQAAKDDDPAAVAKAAQAGFGGGSKEARPAADAPPPLERAKLEVLVAEKALLAAEAQPASIQARAAADRAKNQQPPPADLATTIVQAVRAQRVAAVAKADEERQPRRAGVASARGQRGQEGRKEKKKEEADKKLAAAKTALDAARKATDAPGNAYTPLAGSLKTPESNLETEESRRKPYPTTSTGRRTALARWITDPKNPLTARVAVNHIWARHIGKPLVTTVFDFGRKGTPPTHPELLDWLAIELVEHGWSMKHIHRLIVTSNTYRLSSSSAGASAKTLAADPENRYYWRGNPIRMEAELVRDSLLSLAGELDPTRGGPPIPAADEKSRRRSLYFFHSHNEYMTFLSMFDDASVLECYRRAESIVPQQALALENSPLAAAMAEKIARRIAADNPNAADRDFVRAAFLTVLAVEPTRRGTERCTRCALAS